MEPNEVEALSKVAEGLKVCLEGALSMTAKMQAAVDSWRQLPELDDLEQYSKRLASIAAATQSAKEDADTLLL